MINLIIIIEGCLFVSYLTATFNTWEAESLDVSIVNLG
jgi:hypothetical protein